MEADYCPRIFNRIGELEALLGINEEKKASPFESTGVDEKNRMTEKPNPLNFPGLNFKTITKLERNPKSFFQDKDFYKKVLAGRRVKTAKKSPYPC